MADDILIVDDEADIRSLIEGILEDEGYGTRQAGQSAQAFAEIEQKCPDLLILDIWLENSEQDGLEILKTVKAQHPDLPVVMISGHGTIETAVEAIREGAYDFIEKPFKSDRLLVMIARALEMARLKQENESLRERAGTDESAEMIGTSPAISTLRQTLEKVAPSNSRVLMTGECGAGKEIAARFLHKKSDRGG